MLSLQEVLENYFSFYDMTKYTIVPSNVSSFPKIVLDNSIRIQESFQTVLKVSSSSSSSKHVSKSYLTDYDNLIALEYKLISPRDTSNNIMKYKIVWSIGFLSFHDASWSPRKISLFKLMTIPIAIFDDEKIFNFNACQMQELLIPSALVNRMIWLNSFKMNYIRQRLIFSSFGFGKGWTFCVTNKIGPPVHKHKELTKEEEENEKNVSNQQRKHLPRILKKSFCSFSSVTSTRQESILGHNASLCFSSSLLCSRICEF